MGGDKSTGSNALAVRIVAFLPTPVKDIDRPTKTYLRLKKEIKNLSFEGGRAKNKLKRACSKGFDQ